MKGGNIMETIYSTKYLNGDTIGSVMERGKPIFKSKYPEKYQNLDYDSPLSEVDVISIEKIFDVKVPKYIDDMKKQGMRDKYTTVRNRYLVNSIRNKMSEERKEFDDGNKSKIATRLQAIGKNVLNYHGSTQHQIS